MGLGTAEGWALPRGSWPLATVLVLAVPPVPVRLLIRAWMRAQKGQVAPLFAASCFVVEPRETCPINPVSRYYRFTLSSTRRAQTDNPEGNLLMSRKPTCFFAIFAGLFLSLNAFAQQLDRANAKEMLDKLGHASATAEFVLTTDQDQRLHTLSKDLLDTLAIQSESPCLLNARDPKVHSHEFVVCNGLFPPGLNPQQPAVDLKLGKTFPWHILSLNFPDEAGDNPQEQEVQYTWEYEFSGLPAQVQEILRGTPHPGRSLFRFDGGAWHWVAYQ